MFRLSPTLFIFICLLSFQLRAQKEDAPSLRDPFLEKERGLYLESPIKEYVHYDIQKKLYVIEKRIGNIRVGAPLYLTLRQYSDYILRERMRDYYRSKSRALDEIVREQKASGKSKKEIALDKKRRLLPNIKVKSKFFDTIFGGSTIELIPQGRIGLDLGAMYQKIEDPRLPPAARSSTAINIDRKMQVSVLGRVGKNLELKMNYDTNAGFSFENRMNLGFKGEQDDIVKKIELGNVSMPLSTSLIRGVQSLFGVKGEFQFGKTDITTVFSQQRSQTQNFTATDEGTLQSFDRKATDYQDNQHYFLAHYFYENYDGALMEYPQINANVLVEQLEVWALDNTAGGQAENRRSIVALRDLGESGQPNPPAPNNDVNTLYPQISAINGIRDFIQAEGLLQSRPSYQNGEHFLVKRNARLLSSNDYTFNSKLGFISLKRRLEDRQMLAVAFRLRDTRTGQLYKVGELTNDLPAPEALIVKLLKPSQSLDVSSPMWKLMMKNIYSIGSRFSEKGFLLNLYYDAPGEGSANYLKSGDIKSPLLYIMNFDRLNASRRVQRNAPGATQALGDGLFDYEEGITVNSEQGLVIFTKAEPFGKNIRDWFSSDPKAASKYAFDELYTMQKSDAIQAMDKNRYRIKGEYTGRSFLGSLAEGSMRVMIEGKQLSEGVDYTVDYQSGELRIVNPSLKGKKYTVSYENQNNFLSLERTFLGFNFDHHFSKNFNLGATLVNYSEKPLTQKVQYNHEAVNNTIFGLHANYSSELPFLTRWIDAIPFVSTKAPSKISLSLEGAYFKPGTASGIRDQVDIDNFDTDQSKISLTSRPEIWSLSSVPAGGNPDFPNGDKENDLSSGYYRGMISWYNIASSFYNPSSTEISKDELSKNMTRQVESREIFTGKELSAGDMNYINTFDLTFFPDTPGPYNFNPSDESPRSRWGGLMRPLTTTNFEQSNIQYLEFWMMDPFADDTGSEGEFLVHLGNVSEDILKDGRQQYENGLPYSGSPNPVLNSVWGKIPQKDPVVYTFDTQGQSRSEQDLGLDGLSDEEELKLYGNFSYRIQPVTGALDPSGDNYVYYLDNRWNALPQGSSLVERYKYFRNTQGNSPSNSSQAATGAPDTEDINQDYNMDRLERYYEYKLKISRADLNNTTGYVVDKKEVSSGLLPNGTTARTTWYQFRIPLSEGQAFGGMKNLSSMNYMRLVMKGFDRTTTLRFASMDLVRSRWRPYHKNLYPDNEDQPVNLNPSGIAQSNLEIGSVDIEQNGRADPPYVLPPGLRREELFGVGGAQYKNEASLLLKIHKIQSREGAEEKRARGVFLDYNGDFRLYKKLRMYIHAENLDDSFDKSLDLNARVFLRLGRDEMNYYEYEIPVKYTAKGSISADEIWPQENLMEVAIQDFIKAKSQRDTLGSYSLSNRFSYIPDAKHKDKIIYVRGRPSLGSLSLLLIGLRNTSLDRSVKNVLLWVNELKLVGIDKNGGYAATGRLDLTLADLGQISMSGNYMGAGFGSLEQKPSERSQKTEKNYKINTTVNLDKFFPKKWGLQLPLNYDQSERFLEPKYNPLENDLKINGISNELALKKAVRDYSKSTGYHLNMRKINAQNKSVSRPWDLENFSFFFSYRNDLSKDIYKVYQLRRNMEAGLNYSFSFTSKFYKPFRLWKLAQEGAKWAPYLKWIREISINPLPSLLSFTLKNTRIYEQNLPRDIQLLKSHDLSASNAAFSPFYSANFRLDWDYKIGFMPTKDLKLNYFSGTQTLLDGMMAFSAPSETIIWRDFLKVGKPTRYNQSLDINYQLPISSLPFMDWFKTNLGYRVTYQWDAQNLDLQKRLGNQIQNSQNISLSGNLNFERLYGQIPAFKRLDDKIKKYDIQVQRQIALLNAYSDKKRKKERQLIKDKNIRFSVKDYLLMALSGIKKLNVDYRINNGSAISGFLPQPGFFGQGNYSDSGIYTGRGPSWGFLFGGQSDIRQKAIENRWISLDDQAISRYDKRRDENLRMNLQLELFRDFRVDLDFHRRFNTQLFQDNFNKDNDPSTPGFQNNFPLREFSYFEMSFSAIKNTFTQSQSIYQRIHRNSQVIASRMGRERTDFLSSQDVLLPAFLSAASGVDPSKIQLGYKRNIPIPNWRISYNGLSRLKALATYIERFELVHAYRSSYAVRNIQTNIDYFQNPQGKDQKGRPLQPTLYGSAVLSSYFSPLLQLNMTLRNQFQISARHDLGRNLSLNFTGNTISENTEKKWELGVGYTFKNLKFRMRFRNKRKTIKSDLNIRATAGITDTQMNFYKIVENDMQKIGGLKQIDLNLISSYNLSKNFLITAFLEYRRNQYKISTAYPRTTFRAGLNMIFTFGN